MSKISKLDGDLALLVKSGVIIADLIDGIREVVQNSVDAGARNISVVVVTNNEFKVVDDGIGISPDCLELVGERYCTSKISRFDQLKNLKTFGFRGEALNSLVSVSNVLIVSKIDSYNGCFRVVFTNSRRHEVKMIDEKSEYYNQLSKSGTIVHITKMFNNLPVRQKFLKSIPDSKILNEIRDIILQICISNPEISVKVSFEDKLVCKIDPKPNLKFQDLGVHLLNSIYGINLKGNSNLLTISYKNYRIDCLIGLLPIQTKIHQYIYYNQRLVKDEQLLSNINKLFSSVSFGQSSRDLFTSSIGRNDTSPKKGTSPTKLATSTGNPYKLHPVFLIQIIGSPSSSDLVQDPSKRIVDLKQFDIINPLILRLINQFLKTHHYNSNVSLQKVSENDSETSPLKDKSLMVILSNNRLKFGKTSTKELLGMIKTGDKDTVNKRVIIDKDRVLKRRHFSKVEPCNHENDAFVLEKSITRETLENCKVISQIDCKFILIKFNSSLYVIDQHACDERIKLERNISNLINQVNDPFNDIGIYLNDKTFKIKVNQNEYGLFKHYLNQCSNWGIKYKFMDDEIEITHLPNLLIKKIDNNGNFLSKCILQYLYDLENKSKLKEISKDWWLSIQSIPTILIELMNSNACRDAIMFGDKLTKEECELLIKDLQKCKNPFYCAHGRPSIVPIYNLMNNE